MPWPGPDAIATTLTVRVSRRRSKKIHRTIFAAVVSTFLNQTARNFNSTAKNLTYILAALSHPSQPKLSGSYDYFLI